MQKQIPCGNDKQEALRAVLDASRYFVPFSTLRGTSCRSRRFAALRAVLDASRKDRSRFPAGMTNKKLIT
jgi:hypothetical protein